MNAFRKNPSINPVTGESVKIGSVKYKKLTQLYGELSIKSPKSNKKITIGKGEYKKLLKNGYTEQQLLSLIDNDKINKKNKNIKNEKNEDGENNVFTYLKIKDIHFASYLDYVDILNLTKTNKMLANYISNPILKNILYKNKLIKVDDINIVHVLNPIYDKIQSMIDMHYDKLPLWINVYLFKYEMNKRLIKHFVDKLAGYYRLKDGYKIRTSLKVNMLMGFINIPSISDDYCRIKDINYTISINMTIVKYIKNTIINVYNYDPLDHRIHYNTLYDLFFIKY